MRQGKDWGGIELPPAGMKRNPGAPFGQALDQPMNKPPFIFEREIAALIQNDQAPEKSGYPDHPFTF